MKIIDLLNKIANGETVLFKYRDITYYYNYDFKEYISTQKYYRLGDIMEHYFLLEEIDMTNLNDEVEILEEENKLPKKLEGIDSLFKIEQDLDLKGFLAWQKSNNKIIENKINEIIDYLKSKGE